MTKQMTKKEIAESKTMTEHEKQKLLNELREPYKAMSDEELLQLVRDFTEENGREPMRKDVLYDRELKKTVRTMDENARKSRNQTGLRILFRRQETAA